MLDKKSKIKNNTIEEKLIEIGLDLEKIPEILQENEKLDFRITKTYDDKHYKEYRFLPIKDIQILLSPTNRLDELEKRYKNASPIYDYLDNKNEENIIKHTTFLNMLKNLKLENLEILEEEQKLLNKKIPFKVKFSTNYLWQIYYSEINDKYFMLVPTEDEECATFFYLLKKKLSTKRVGKIFVPIRNAQYSNEYLKKSQYEDLQNYLWLFTKQWPQIYNVYDKDDNLSIQIIGETPVYDKIKSPYKIKLNNKEEANKFYKLLKALFILQTELPHYYKFKTQIGKIAGIEFLLDEEKVEFETITDFIDNQYEESLQKKKIAEDLIKKYKKKLEEIKELATSLDIEYIAKEKQISTFLECKKSFFGKFKYYFKYGKSNKKEKTQKVINKQEIKIQEENKPKKQIRIKRKENYTLEELIQSYKAYEIQENEIKNIIMDINALKLKNKNMKKKIENATLYIEEIDNHKKSIFEFWKYSNKDEVAALTEGEKEEVNVIKKVIRVFDYNEDFEKFSEQLDNMQREKLTKEDTDNIFITTTSQLAIINKIKNNKVLPKDIENSLKNIKKEEKEEKLLTENEEFDIFAGRVEDNTKIRKIANKNHRELPKDKFKILDVNKNSKQIGYKLVLTSVIDNIKTALEKIEIPEDIPIYKAVDKGKLNALDINLFNINPELELKKVIDTDERKINLYKINLKKGNNAIGYTNIIYYDNENKTLPVGMNLDTRILTDISKLRLTLKQKDSFKITQIENEKDDFSSTCIKTINIYEYDVLEKKEIKENNN